MLEPHNGSSIPSIMVAIAVTVSQICREAEAAIFHEQLRSDLKRAREFQGMHITDPMQTAAHAAVEAACRAHASAIFVVTSTGKWVLLYFCFVARISFHFWF
ncbi:unnamed protein product [Protopolystoma xenopodis]|uniref:Pyruvate kinase C-terminal domain-containing protein n=1 Tax=Protopolystoma xenopodis TaxID=117903 RepID=A0A448WHN1_9PLAT|nr:unnamed protein product [Protopolystoma xenopodis]